MAGRTAKRQSKETIRGAQKAWLEDVLRLTQKQPSQLATEAGLSDTTLTRFLNSEDHTGTLSTMTISQIVEATGIAPPGGAPATPARPSFQEEAAPYNAEPGGTSLADLVLAHLATKPNASPWVMKSDVLALQGVRRGDVLVIEMGLAPQDGDVVCAQIYEGISARTVFRVYQAPFIVGASMGPPVRPELVDGVRVAVVGVMTDLLRRRKS